MALCYFIHLRNWSSFLSGETETLFYEKRLCLPRQVKSRSNEHQKYAALISHRGLRMSLIWISKPVVFHGMSPSVIYCCIWALPRRCRSFNQSLCRLSTFYPFYVDVSRPRCMFTCNRAWGMYRKALHIWFFVHCDEKGYCFCLLTFIHPAKFNWIPSRFASVKLARSDINRFVWKHP